VGKGRGSRPNWCNAPYWLVYITCIYLCIVMLYPRASLGVRFSETLLRPSGLNRLL